MTKISDDVLRKIKRCMDLSSSSNENEAALALKQMQSLMQKNGVTSQHVIAFDVMLRKLKADRVAFIKNHLSRYKAANKTKLADAYCQGWISNVYSKVENLNPNLEVEKKIKAYKEINEEEYSDKVYEAKARFKKNDDKAQAALNMGFVESKEIDLFVATGHTEQVLIGESV